MDKRLEKTIKFFFGNRNRFEDIGNISTTPFEDYISKKMKVKEKVGHILLELIKFDESNIIVDLLSEEVKVNIEEFCKDNKITKYYLKKILYFIKNDKIYDLLTDEGELMWYSGVHFIEYKNNKLIIYYNLSDTLECEKELSVTKFRNL